MKIASPLLLWLLLTVAAMPALPAGGLHATGQWIREAPPGSRVMVGYGTLTNTGSEDRVVTSAVSDAFGAVEFHRTTIEDGVARMTRHETLVVAAGESLDFAPGGYHFMLFRPQRPLRAGDRATLHLHLDNGTQLRVIMPVRTTAPRQP